MLLPLLTYLHMYLIAFTDLQYSTFMCALNVFDNKGEYGTNHRLSTSMVVPLSFFIIAVLPPYSVDLLLYCGKPSLPVIVLGTKSRGYRFVHLPLAMHGDYLFIVPQGPCIIFFTTISYNPLSTISIISDT